MEVAFTRTLEALLLPPGGLLIAAALGMLWHWRGGRRGLAVTALALALLYLASLPPLATLLLRGLERYPALTEQQLEDSGAGAIVVLGAGRYDAAPEYGGDTVSPAGLERLRYGVKLQRLTRLPLIVTGGSPLAEAIPEAALSARYLRDELHATPVWQEDGSATTGFDARLTKHLLDEKGIRRVLLVTHAWHMARSVASFRRVGLEVVAAPTAFATGRAAEPWWFGVLPQAWALRDTRIALHEYLGMVWYRIRY